MSLTPPGPRRGVDSVPAGHAGIVVAGGGSRRMGGLDKAAVEIGGVTLLDRVLGALRPLCRELVVVGPRRPTTIEGARFVLEDEPGGGPVPAVLAGLAATSAPLLLVLAADLPLVTTADLDRLVAALEADPSSPAAAALDDRAGLNPLCAAYRRAALEPAANPPLPSGTPAARLLPTGTVGVDLGPVATLNVNRPADLLRAQRLVDRLDHDDR